MYKELKGRIAELENICREAYIATDVLAELAGVFDYAQVQALLDNLSSASMVHDGIIPFTFREKL